MKKIKNISEQDSEIRKAAAVLIENKQKIGDLLYAVTKEDFESLVAAVHPETDGTFIIRLGK